MLPHVYPEKAPWRDRCWQAGRVALSGVLLLAVQSCALPVSEGTKSPADLQVLGGVAGAVVDVGAIVAAPGIADYALQVAGQGRREVSVWFPEAKEPRALVLLLHGAAPKRTGHHVPEPLGPTRALLRCLAAPALQGLDPIIIAPGSPTGQWWRHEETELVLGLVLAVRERWPRAGSRSIIMGYSNGGIGTWYFARLYPEYFAAAVPMAFNETIPGQTPVPVYAIHGIKDETFEFPAVRAAVQAVIQQGSDVTFEAKYRGTHLAPCSYVPELTHAAHWLEQRVLSRREGVPAR
jgi:hypothetical protein